MRWLVPMIAGLALLSPASGLTDEGADPTVDEVWEPVRNADGVQVSRLDGTAGERPAFRGETLIDAEFFEVLAVLEDDSRRVDWMSRCIESRRLEARSGGRFVTYNRTRGRWPVADRDAVIETSTMFNRDRTQAHIRLRTTESELMPPIEGVVRMPALEGYFHVSAITPDRTRVVYQETLDLGGRIPGFIAEGVSADMPFQTLSGLRALVVRTRGEYAERAQELRANRPSAEAGARGAPHPAADPSPAPARR